MAHSRVLSLTDSRSGQSHVPPGAVSRMECEQFTRRLEDLQKQLTTSSELRTSVVAVKDRLQSFSSTMHHKLQLEGGQLVRATEEGWTLTDRTVALNNASSQFSASHSDATSCIIAVEEEIGMCQKELDIRRKDLEKLRTEIEEARREASRLRDECRCIAKDIERIDSMIQHWREEERRHRNQAEHHKKIAIGVGVAGLVLAPFTFGLSAVAAAPATVINVVEMSDEEKEAERCDDRKRERKRELETKEAQKDAWKSKIDELSKQCSRKEADIGKFTALTKLLTEVRTFLQQVASSFDSGRNTVAAMVEEIESIKRGNQTLRINSSGRHRENSGKSTSRNEILTSVVQVRTLVLTSLEPDSRAGLHRYPDDVHPETVIQVPGETSTRQSGSRLGADPCSSNTFKSTTILTSARANGTIWLASSRVYPLVKVEILLINSHSQ